MKKNKKKYCDGCEDITRKDGVLYCCLFGLVTAELEKQCKRQGWKNWKADHGTRKVPHYPPCP